MNKVTDHNGKDTTFTESNLKDSMIKPEHVIDYELIENTLKSPYSTFDPYNLLRTHFQSYFEGQEQCSVIENIFSLTRGKVNEYQWFKHVAIRRTYQSFMNDATFSFDRFGKTGRHLYYNANFPFGYHERAYKRHHHIMSKRHEDIKSKLFIPPNFNSSNSYGLEEMRDYLNDKVNTYKKKRPKVKGRTFVITASKPQMKFSSEGESLKSFSGFETYSKDYAIRHTFLNHYDNVEHPISYFIKFKFASDNVYGRKFIPTYAWDTLPEIIINMLNPVLGFNFFNREFENYDIICFNLFELPLRESIIEYFMNFMLSFHQGHPNIYIKDISGMGYSAYMKYSFYERLLNSNIDIGNYY